MEDKLMEGRYDDFARLARQQEGFNKILERIDQLHEELKGQGVDEKILNQYSDLHLNESAILQEIAYKLGIQDGIALARDKGFKEGGVK